MTDIRERHVQASISIGPRQALRTGLYLIWQAIRHPRSSVTFTMEQDR